MSKRLIRQAVEQYGSQRKLADAIGFTQEAVSHAQRTGRVSPHMAIMVQAATRGRIKARELCPELDLKRARKRVNGARR